MQAKNALIIGGGLGGLALAQGLKGSGINVTVFERDASPASRSQGYVIVLNNDSEASLAEVNIDAYDATAIKHVVNHIMADPELNPTMHLPFGRGKGFVVSRWKLREVLQQGVNVQWGKQFVKYEEKGDRVVAYFEDGTTAEGDVLIGADGASSRVRQQRTQDITSEKLPVAHCVASMTYQPQDLPKLHEMLQSTILRVKGPNGISMMAVAFVDGDEKVMCWTFNFPHPNLPDDVNEFKKEIISQAGSLHPEIVKLVQLTPTSRILSYRHLHYSHPRNERPLGETTRVTLLGDAVHAMTPHAGLGANTAFKDAVDLAKALKADDLHTGLQEYESILVKRGFAAVETSVSNTMKLAGHSEGDIKLFGMYSIGEGKVTKTT